MPVQDEPVPDRVDERAPGRNRRTSGPEAQWSSMDVGQIRRDCHYRSKGRNSLLPGRNPLLRSRFCRYSALDVVSIKPVDTYDHCAS